MKSSDGRVIKRIISGLLTAALLTCSFSMSLAAVFTDLEGAACREAVEALSEKGVLNGYGDGSFKPENSITRAEICVAISKAMNPAERKYSIAKKNSFKDVNNSYSWAEKYINYASAMKAIDGYPEGVFKPYGKITYDELSAMILKAMGYGAEQLSGVWPYNFRQKAEELKLYEGIFNSLSKESKETFDYSASATRGHAAVMIYTALEELRERGLEELPVENIGEYGSYYDEDYDWISGDEIKISMSEAVKIMQTKGYLAQMAEINKASDEAIARGYSDNVKSLKNGLEMVENLEKQEKAISSALNALQYPEGFEMLDIEEKAKIEAQINAQRTELEQSLSEIVKAIDTMEGSGITKANLDMAKLQKDFASKHIDDNYEAQMNSIEYQTLSLYYGVLQAEENLSICEENIFLQEKLLNDIKSKYSVGMATQMQVMAQQSALDSAKEEAEAGKINLEKAKMNFNMLLGFKISDNIVLTDKIEPHGWKEVNIDKAVKEALDSRLSIVQLEYACEIQRLSLKAMSKSSSTGMGAYKKQAAALEMTEAALENMPKNIEIEIRSAYLDLKKKYDAMAEGRKTLELAKESLRIAEVMYKAGMSTISELQKAQYSLKQANLLDLVNISSYNMALVEFGYMTGVGKERIDL